MVWWTVGVLVSRAKKYCRLWSRMRWLNNIIIIRVFRKPSVSKIPGSMIRILEGIT